MYWSDVECHADSGIAGESWGTTIADCTSSTVTSIFMPMGRPQTHVKLIETGFERNGLIATATPCRITELF